jgi:ribonuclease R
MAKPPSRSRSAGGGLPSRDEVLRYLRSTPGEVSKRDLVRAFHLKGPERTGLKDILRELEGEGALARGRRRRVRPAGRLPNVAVLEITGTDADGDLIARPVGRGDDEGQSERVVLHADRRRPSPGIGDRVLARLSRRPGEDYAGSIIRVLPSQPRQLVGIVQRARDGLRLVPIGKNTGGELRLAEEDAAGLEGGELVAVERVEGSALGLGRARMVERLGSSEDPRAISLMTAHTFALPASFPPEAQAQAEQAKRVELGKRLDLRDLPLVTIDGADARDFDDAVWAAPDDAADNPGGWQIVVAIADVAHYVHPGDALDREARRRGNSVYFPDRVLPMLPEALSNGLCSLRPDEDRACLAVRIRLDARGRMIRHRFARALMRSRARLTYDQVQAARDGRPHELTAPLMADVILPLYGALDSLLEARRRRGTLDLDLPEVQVRLDATGRPVAIEPRPRIDSHRLIEELMIAANVAAAEALEQAGTVCMYRVHDKPDPIKLEALADLLDRLGVGGGRGTLGRPKDIARLLERVQEHELAPTISSFVLRAQSQAVYSPDNIGHFGLNLGRYAHFTSPIRRYADLLVHRALIRAHRLGAGGLEGDVAGDDWRELGAWISRTERRAMEAERAVLGRFIALYMSAHLGTVFAGTITSVQRFGVFVQLDGTLAEGLVPVSGLGEGWFAHDAAHHALIGQDTGQVVAIGDRVRVELAEADPLAGQLAFRLVEHTPGPAAAAALRASRRRGKRGHRVVRRAGRR